MPKQKNPIGKAANGVPRPDLLSCNPKRIRKTYPTLAVYVVDQAAPMATRDVVRLRMCQHPIKAYQEFFKALRYAHEWMRPNLSEDEIDLLTGAILADVFRVASGELQCIEYLFWHPRDAEASILGIARKYDPAMDNVSLVMKVRGNTPTFSSYLIDLPNDRLEVVKWLFDEGEHHARG